MDRRMFVRGSVGLAGAVLLGACTDSSSDTSVTPTTLGDGESADRLAPAPRPTLRLSGGDFGFPSPFTYARGPGYWRMSYLYDTLLWKDATGELLPWLASSFERSADGLTYTFELRDGILWSDGTPFTADDVVFTFDYFASQQLSPQVFVRPQDIDTVSAVDARTVEVRLSGSVATFAESVAGALPIVPRHIWSSIADSSTVSDPSLLVGTGPYRLESYSQGEGAYLFTANDDYFLGRPFVERIENLPVGDELTALLAGELDAGGPPPALGIVGETTLAPFRNDPSFGVLEGPGDFTVALYWNLARGGALADVGFRQGCATAIDRADIVERLLGGNGEPGNPGFLPPSHPFHTDVEQYPFDIDAANDLLDEAGYGARGPGEVRQGADGQPLRFDLLVAAPPPPVTELVVGALRAVGIELTVQAVDRPTSDARTSSGDYDMAIINYGGLGGDPDYLRQVYSSQVPKRFQSAQGYANAEVDELGRAQLDSLDEEERRPLVAQIQELVAADLPLLPLYYPKLFHVFRRDTFDQWYFTPGGFAAGVPTVYNKQAFITGVTTGTEVRPIEE